MLRRALFHTKDFDESSTHACACLSLHTSCCCLLPHGGRARRRKVVFLSLYIFSAVEEPEGSVMQEDRKGTRSYEVFVSVSVHADTSSSRLAVHGKGSSHHQSFTFRSLPYPQRHSRVSLRHPSYLPSHASHDSQVK